MSCANYIDDKEIVIRVNGFDVEMLFTVDGEETFDPTEAHEYLDEGQELLKLEPEDEVAVIFNPMMQTEE